MSDNAIAEPPTEGSAAAKQQLAVLHKGVRRAEKILTWKRKRARWVKAAIVIAIGSFASWMGWTATYWGNEEALTRGRWLFIPSLAVAVAFLGSVAIHHVDRKSTAKESTGSVPQPERFTQTWAEAQERLDDLQESIRILSSSFGPPLSQRRSLYRESIAGVIEQYRQESRYYRTVHNSLQSLIMIGSVAVTTLAALEAKEWNLPTILMIVLGFCVTIATAFTGYYKYRERSYFLQQTADAIEEQSNALTLGVGEYFSQPDDVALAQFTQRVENIRNEQRRRQQQLDQPADQAPPPSQ
ncbi:DUF4231 domain-containing protein [Streptomyces sp. BG2AG]|uniref:DUF4231 domain-containing protein n=1 Tax=unclassified Streptomyces TaxID=2593676 RepID=UPI0039F007B4